MIYCIYRIQISRKDIHMDRVILHCDMNSFFASVELLSHPELKNLPVAVCGDPDSRHGIILAKNEPAKKFGVKTAETIHQAQKKCPELILLPPHMEKYKYYSAELNKIYQRFTDLVEPFSIDESWLDVTSGTALLGSGRQIADNIRETVKRELGLTLSAGVSFNKFFAKMGSEYKKPDATTEITRENFRELLWPLPVSEMFFVGKASAEKLHKVGIKTIGALAQSSPAVLSALLGKNGEMLRDNANGLDNSPVARFDEQRQIKSVGNGTTFRRNLLCEDDILTAVTALSDMVSSRLRKHGMKACGVKIDIKDPDFHVISRQKQLLVPSNLSSEIAKAAMEIIYKSWDMRKAIRLITITAIQLIPAAADEQLSIFASDTAARIREEKLSSAMDEVREKYGSAAIGFAAVLNNDIGVSIRDDMLESNNK